MQSEKGAKAHRLPPSQLLEHDNASREGSSTANCYDDERGSDGAALSRERVSRPDESTSAARLRRSCRVPRPTASASTALQAGQLGRDDGARRSTRRRLPTLHGVVISSPTYSASPRPRAGAGLVASIVAKCRIPAPVATRRISSWTDGCDSPTQRASTQRAHVATTSRFNDPTSAAAAAAAAGHRSPDSGDSPAAADEVVESRAADLTTRPEPNFGARFSADDEHVCCSCAGKGVVSSHLLCVRPSATVPQRENDHRTTSTRRTSPRAVRVYRFDASARHRVAVAQAAIETGLERLTSAPRRSGVLNDDETPLTTGGDRERSAVERAAAGHDVVDYAPQLDATATHATDLLDSPLQDVTAFSERLSDETGSHKSIPLPLPLNLDDEKLKTKAAPASNRRLSITGELSIMNESQPEMSGSPAELRRLFRFTSNSICAAMSSQKANDQQLASASYTVTDGTTASGAIEKSVSSELENVAESHLLGSRSSAIQMTKSSKEKAAVFKAAEATVATKSLADGHARTRRKWFESDEVGDQSGKRMRCTPTDGDRSRMKSDGKKFVTLSGSDAPLNFAFAARHRTSPPPSVSFADKHDARRTQRPARRRSAASARPSWRDLLVVVPTSLQPLCHSAAETSTENSFERLSGQTTDVSATLEPRSVELYSRDRSTAAEQCSELQSVAAKTGVTESADTAYTSENLVVRHRTTCSNCDETTSSQVKDCHQQGARSSCGAEDAMPSFIIGVTPPPSLSDARPKRPASSAADSRWVEATPSFISCCASEKDFPRSAARQKSSVDKRSARRKTSAVSGVRSSATRSKLSSTSVGSFTGDNRPSALSSENKTSSKDRKSTAAESICQRRSESLRASTTTAEKDETVVPGSRVKRSPTVCSVADARRTECCSGLKLHKAKQLSESNKRSGNLLKNAPICIQPERTDSRRKATDSGMKCATLNPVNKLSDGSQSAVENAAPVPDSKVTKVDKMPSAYSTCLLDETSSQLPSHSFKKAAVAYFISCPRSGGSRTTPKSSHIPRPQTRAVGVAVKSRSYVVCAAGTSTDTREHTASSVQRSASAERPATNRQTTSPTFADVRVPVVHDDGGRSSQLEPRDGEAHSSSVSPAALSLADTPHRRHTQYADDTGSRHSAWQPLFPADKDAASIDCESHRQPNYARLNATRPPNEPSTDEIARLTTQAPAVATDVVDEHHSQSIGLSEYATPLLHEPSAQQSTQLAMPSHFSTPCVEPNLETISPLKNRLQFSRIDPVHYVDTADCETVEKSQCSATSYHERLVEVKPATLSSYALEVLAPRPVQRRMFRDGADPVNVENTDRRRNVGTSQRTTKDGQLSRGDASPNAATAREIRNTKAHGRSDIATKSCEKRLRSTSLQEVVLSAAPVPPLPSEQASSSPQRASRRHASFISAEPNPKRLSNAACRNRLCVRRSTRPAKYVEAADCETTEQFFTTYHDERPIGIEMAVLENDALEMPTDRRLAQRSKKSREALHSKSSAVSAGEIRLNVGLEVRLRSFDEVSIGLPDVVWTRLQSGEIRHPELARVCRSALEAVVLRSALRLPTSVPPPRRRAAEGRTAPRRKTAVVPSRLLARAYRRRHFAESGTEELLSVSVVRSLVDQSVQSVNAAFQLSPPNISSNEDTPTSRRVAEIYPAEQLAVELTPTNRPVKRNASRHRGPELSDDRQTRHRRRVADLSNVDERKETVQVMQEENERGGNYEEARPKQTTSSRCTPTAKFRNKDKQLDIITDGQTCLRLPRHDPGFIVSREDETKGERRDDHRLPVDGFARKNEDRDDVMSDDVLSVLAATDEGHAAVGEASWQWSEDGVERQSVLSSG